MLDHYEIFCEFEASCDAGCPLCRTFFSTLVYNGIEWKNTSHLQWSLSHFDGLWSLICKSDARPDGRSVWPMKGDAEYQPSQAITTVKRLATETLEDDLASLLDESIQPWINACTRSGKHENCPRVPAHELRSYSMPTRLIDVGVAGESAVRLVNTADQPETNKQSPYLILSYCWGSGNDSARTTSQNLKDRLAEINCNGLPETIQDAIRLTRLMKIRYLSVDAVCIIQSNRDLNAIQQDDDAKADWERESTHMGEYYANSLCCIAASSAKDSSEGILTERRVAKYEFKKWLNPPNVFLPSPHAIIEETRSLLFERGWCLQEWILSPRILHWTANGLIWECSHGFFWEGQKGFRGETPEGFSDEASRAFPDETSSAISDEASEMQYRQTNDCLLDFGINAGLQVSRILNDGEDEGLGKCWTEMISTYSHMHLSVSSDRLAAVFGIAKRLSERHKVDYFAGISRSRCSEHLMWVTEDPESPVGVNENFPTWS